MPPTSFDPVYPEFPRLEPRAAHIVRQAGEVGWHLHPATLDAVTDLLRTINCYYSNLIEGHDTHPVQIERALRGDLSSSPALRDLQLEARAHIEVQRKIELRLADEPELNVCDPRFLRWIHAEFYRELPEELRVVRHPDGNWEEQVVAGELRHFDVKVGDHVAPLHQELDSLLDRFSQAYDPNRLLNENRPVEHSLSALGAAHHRLLWIHPFGDGNGRVTRLMTDAYLRRIGVGAHGLWTVSRGLARARVRYKQALANADQPRWNDYDGRGPLSARGLNEFCAFFLDVCDDQLSYMSGMLAVDGLMERLTRYCRAREAGAIAAPGDVASATAGGSRRGRPTSGFRPEATRLLRTLLAQGPLPREEVEEVTTLGDRTARRLVRSLVDEGFIVSATQRAPLYLRFPAHAAPYVFPGLYGPPVTSTAENRLAGFE